jgi:16S rRNA (cytosine967-C5)-methyltransferase
MTARDAARAVLRRVEQGEAYASLALDGALGRSRLGPEDRGLATTLVYGVLRHRTRLDRALAAHAPRGLGGVSRPALIALRLAAFQILELRTPPHAAVNDAVGAVREIGGEKLAGFANAILRRLAAAGEPAPPDDLAQRLVDLHSMPRWIADRLLAAVGAGEAEEAAAAMNRPPPVWLRASGDPAEAEAAIRAERSDADLARPASIPEAIRVRGGGAPETMDAFRRGLVTVQDLAAQLVGRLAGALPGERILDACAGVGGKSTHLALLARAAGGPAKIDAADVSARKLDLAVDTARRLGVADDLTPIVCDLTDPTAPLATSYDRVVLDAPCSGLGVLRRHPEAKWRRADAGIAELAELQARLLAAVAPRVRPGGVLVYSVCTFTAEEGEGQITRFLAESPHFRVDGSPLRTWPHRDDADAFYAVRLVRT